MGMEHHFVPEVSRKKTPKADRKLSDKDRRQVQSSRRTTWTTYFRASLFACSSAQSTASRLSSGP